MSKLHRWWAALLYYTWFIVVWGALVRASGSGDGCGKNWPTCHGELFPPHSTIETLIEYIHRATSGLYGIFVFALVIITLRHVRKNINSSSKNSASNFGLNSKWLFYLLPSLVLLLTIFEALIGAKLVLSGLVGSNTSWARALIMIFHLLNTFLLVSSIVGTQHLLKPREFSDDVHINKLLYSICILSLVFVAGLGALTALGDTLYPAESLHHGVYQDFALGTPWILRLRVLHPVLALLTVFLITNLVFNFLFAKRIKIYIALTYLTLVIGICNLLLLAPIYMQVIHLLSAQALWSAHSQLGFELFLPKKS